MAEDVATPEKTEATDTADTEQATKQHDGKPTIAVKVYAPFKVYFEGDAYSVSAVNETGPFDIMPHHHNFLCMIVPGELKVQALDGDKSYKLPRALMHVKADRVDVFVDV